MWPVLLCQDPVDVSPLMKLGGFFSRLHSAEDDVVRWLTNLGRWTRRWKKKFDTISTVPSLQQSLTVFSLVPKHTGRHRVAYHGCAYSTVVQWARLKPMTSWSWHYSYYAFKLHSTYRTLCAAFTFYVFYTICIVCFALSYVLSYSYVFMLLCMA